MSLDPSRGFYVLRHTFCEVCERIVDENGPDGYEIKDGLIMHKSCAHNYDEAVELIERTTAPLVCADCGIPKEEAESRCPNSTGLGGHLWIGAAS